MKSLVLLPIAAFQLTSLDTIFRPSVWFLPPLSISVWVCVCVLWDSSAYLHVLKLFPDALSSLRQFLAGAFWRMVPP